MTATLCTLAQPLSEASAKRQATAGLAPCCGRTVHKQQWHHLPQQVSRQRKVDTAAASHARLGVADHRHADQSAARVKQRAAQGL